MFQDVTQWWKFGITIWSFMSKNIAANLSEVFSWNFSYLLLSQSVAKYRSGGECIDRYTAFICWLSCTSYLFYMVWILNFSQVACVGQFGTKVWAICRRWEMEKKSSMKIKNHSMPILQNSLVRSYTVCDSLVLCVLV